ncbi:MAG: hypothetical protein EHM42_04745 [Planctomycetaceae bacterium]|nr:MAG: hypothetical protein EHM42_04745 [Planctomycetaceae bacterium]
MVRDRARGAVIVLTVALALAACPSTATLHAASEAEVKNAISRGVAYLKGRLVSQSGGQMALTVLALAKAGDSPDGPELKAGLARLQSTVRNGTYAPADHHRYEAGVTLMALATIDSAKYRPEIEAIARYLIESQETHGGWYYPGGGAGVGQIAGGVAQSGDTSITQYALLGLWEASRAGVNVPKRVWDRAAAWHLATQLKDGSFTYHPSPQSFNPSGTHSMAVAGTSSLLLVRLMLYPEAQDIPSAEIEEAVAGSGDTPKKKRGGMKFGILVPAAADEPEPKPDAEPDSPKVKPLDSDPNYAPTTKLASINNGIVKGIRWLGTNFRADLSTLNIVGQGWNSYYLYGIERLGALSGLVELGRQDWYQEGCEYFVKRQTADGSWNVDQAGQDNGTCFAVLFMVRATEKTLKKTPQRRRDPRLGGGVLVGARGLPDDLTKLELGAAGPKVRKLKGPIDELLGELEKLDGNQVEAAQEAIVETILTEDPEALVGQQDRLLRLAGDRRPDVRRTAVWALGRTNDLTVVPTLIARLEDPDVSVIVEARNALRFMTRQPDFLVLSDAPTPEELGEMVRRARAWYLAVRPYAERDDLLEGQP